MNKSLRCAISNIIIFLLFVTACVGCNKAGRSSETVKLKDAKLNVVTTYGPNDGGHRAFNELWGEFAKKTGVEITDGSADSTEEWKRSVITSFETGEEPDVLFFFTGADVENLIKNNKFVSIDEIRESYPDYASNVNITILEGLSASDDKSYAVPVKGYWERLFINRDIFDELSLPVPEKYDDLFEIAPVLIEAGYIPIAASLGEVPHYLFEALLFNQTGPSGHHSIPSDPGNLPMNWTYALEQFPIMYEAGMFPADADALTHADAFELFQSKKAAMIIDGDWSVAYVRDTEGTAVVNFPADPEGPRKSTDLISGFSMGFYITQKAWSDPKTREAAVAFVQFITSNDSILRLNVSGAAMPIAGFSTGENDQSNVTPLRQSVDALNENTTAFVGAVADRFRPEAREWLFSQILPLAKSEVTAEDVLLQFILINNGDRQ